MAVTKILPAPINLYDNGIKILGITQFSGPYGKQVAVDLTEGISREGVFSPVSPEVMDERLMKTGLAVGWDASPAVLLWVGKRTGVDAVVVGKVEAFEQEGIQKEQETLALVETGEYEFVLNERDKLALQERMDYQKVPLFCRIDHGHVEVGYRIWNTRLAELIGERHFSVDRAVPSFCYRGELSEELKREAESRLRRRLIADVNRLFLDEIIPQKERATVMLEALPRGVGADLVQRNELAIVFVSRGKWEQAEELWLECLRDQPRMAAVHYNLAMVYEVTARLTTAEEHLRAALVGDPKPLYQGALHRVRAARESPGNFH